jgi:hypothetical protein
VIPNNADAWDSHCLDALARAGYETELTFPHWLGKATFEGDMLDLIFRAGNGLCEVDDSWFERARDDQVVGIPVKLCAPEEMIWMKAYIMERERFFGRLTYAADISWLANPVDNNWFNPANWFTGTVPGNSDTAHLSLV